jgi:hypothetical protein
MPQFSMSSDTTMGVWIMIRHTSVANAGVMNDPFNTMCFSAESRELGPGRYSSPRHRMPYEVQNALDDRAWQIFLATP